MAHPSSAPARDVFPSGKAGAKRARFRRSLGILARILLIVAIAEFVVMATLMLHDLRTALLDVLLLSVVAAPLLFFFIVRPEVKRSAREAGRRLSALLETVVEAVLLVDEEGSILLANPAAESLFGYEANELVGRPYDILLPERFRSAHASLHERWFQGSGGSSMAGRDDLVVRRRDGSELPVQISLSRVHTAEGDRAFILLADLSERRRREAELRASEERFRTVSESSPDAIVLAGSDGRIMFFSPSAESLFGWTREEAVGRPVTFLSPERHHEAYRAALRRVESTGRPREAGTTVELEGIRKDGSELPLEISLARGETGSETFLCAMIRDLTERKSLEARLRHAEKMEAVGRMAGGIAHDFNNILTVIGSNAALLLDDVDAGSEAADLARQIGDSAASGAAITRKLLTFGRREELDIRPVDLAAMIERMSGSFRALMTPDTELRLHIEHDVPKVAADEDALERILMNLATNARDAMPDGGVLSLRLEHAHAARPSANGAEDRVKLTVTDTGVGMDAEIRERIFEPFFTTKAPGHGTGLGLATVFGMLKKMDADIAVESDVGAGTSVTISLARAEEDAATPPDAGDDTPTGGTEAVVVVEDDEAIRRTTVRTLERMGYRVRSAESGEEALRLLRGDSCGCDLVLADMTLPGMSGAELMHALRAETQPPRVLLTSGYSVHELGEIATLPPDVPFLQKPWSTEALGRSVREALSAAP